MSAHGAGAHLAGFPHQLTQCERVCKLCPATRVPLYREALAVVMPSICFEVFPMVILEAFREGTPILARRLGPLPEIIADSQAGLLFETHCRAVGRRRSS